MYGFPVRFYFLFRLQRLMRRDPIHTGFQTFFRKRKLLSLHVFCTFIADILCPKRARKSVFFFGYAESVALADTARIHVSALKKRQGGHIRLLYLIHKNLCAHLRELDLFPKARKQILRIAVQVVEILGFDLLLRIQHFIIPKRVALILEHCRVRA